jgi:cytochrome c556
VFCARSDGSFHKTFGTVAPPRAENESPIFISPFFDQRGNYVKSKFLLAAVAGVASAAALAGPIEDQIRFRQSAYSFVAWNCAKIKSQVIDHPETFNKDQIAAAAGAIAATANSGLGALYGTGTDKGIGWKQTRLKPEFFQQSDDARNVGVAFITEANALAKVAEAGNVDAIKAQFGKLGDTCKSCHDKFRIKE